ncbi:hypothetical protein A2966_00860 [Candidatus Roizmanbacteria bacterium RIFCSPLOWO2_01_FULL_41_22]|uniref:DNA 3'-5' helicase n=1 Tax=Candidatus Roizmanbacteria bacterium RIFCSPLOWO2_01_FULL_41_22 TaxID=1802067 RepID=A0A1F7J8H5_9BACT|nr:MAG: hypothetical protein A2966_00860 [Candidatus Roizmanbacteria bacterium RIFCSPLOWO2_01_FULL_41_22]
MTLTDSARLNDNQKKAVEYNSGPLLIVAGAGTGKTLTLVEKIKYLIHQKLARPEEILCLTFTQKAASEMEQRVDQTMPYGYFQMWISTFHAFADEILKEEVAQIGLNPGYSLLSQSESILYLRKRLFQFDLQYFRPLGNPDKFIASLITHFGRLKDEDVSPQEYRRFAQKQLKNKDVPQEEKEKWNELARAYELYQEIKIKEGYFDFSDLIYYLVQLYRLRPNVLKQHRQKFAYLLVDEFQDTNIAQYQLIKLLCPQKQSPQLTVVGDDSQAIYKFRGASISNILTFMKDYPQSKQITLNQNYRSNQTILDSAYRLIKHNDPDTLEAKLKISKQLTASKPDVKKALTFQLTHSLEQEADYVAEEILKLKNQGQFKFTDVAILVRANNHANAFINALSRLGIPYQFLGPGMLFKQSEIKDLIAYLKLLRDLEDSVCCFRVFSMEIFCLDAWDINLLLSFAKKIHLGLLQATEIYLSFFHQDWARPEYQAYQKYLPLLKEDTRNKLIPLVTSIKKHLHLSKTYTAGQLLFLFLEDSGYLKKIANIASVKEEKIALNITKFFNKLKERENQQKDATLPSVVDYLDMSIELGESPQGEDNGAALGNAVNILTVHAAKGLEFPVVFLVNLTQGRFPSTQKKESIPIPGELIKELLPQGDYHLQEERRLFYVGMTRGRDRVYLTTSRFYGEGRRERRISPFVEESVGKEVVQNVRQLKQEEASQLSIFDFKKMIVEEKKDTLSIKNFSYSQLESFKLCPLQYKYHYLLKIPTQPTAAASFGESIHKTLQKFYQTYLDDPKADLPTMLKIFQQLWIPLGYSSPTHQEKMKKEGQKMLIGFYNKFHQPPISIMGLEKLFKIQIENDIYLTGKIDRIDAGQNGQIEIVDYKTGKQPEDKELKKSLQLSIYALAATDWGLYNKKVNDVKLTFYYLQNLEKKSIKRTKEELEQVREGIINNAKKIKASSFEPQVGPWCNFCPFRMICEAWQ